MSEFDSTLCGLTATGWIPQPGTATRLDPIREVVMWRAQYRNFGTYQTLVGTFSVDVDGSDHAGLRWFELRRTGSGAWSLYQEGTYAPDAHHRWFGEHRDGRQRESGTRLQHFQRDDVSRDALHRAAPYRRPPG